MRAFFIREFEEDALAFGVLEAFAVFLEEVMRPALALDADEQRVEVVDAGTELLGARGEDAVGVALEEQERRPRLEQRIGREQLLIPLFKRVQVVGLFGGELQKDGPAARVFRGRRWR